MCTAAMCPTCIFLLDVISLIILVDSVFFTHSETPSSTPIYKEYKTHYIKRITIKNNKLTW
jgi:hypothetical protein